MTIQDNEIQMYKSEVVSEDGTNGGRIDNDAQVISGVVSNVWPVVYKAERDAGGTKYRKTFWKVSNDDDETLLSAQVWIDIITQADDWVVFFAATQTNTASGIVGTEAKYGCGTLNSNISSGASSIVVAVEDESLATGNDAIFRVGDNIRITNKDTPSSLTGTEELIEISSVSNVGVLVTIGLATNTTNAYNTDDNTYGTRVMSVYEPGDIATSVDTYVVTTAGDGDFDDSTYPVTGDNIATIEQTVTLTFSNSTDFVATSNVSGISLGTGSTASDFSPSNPDYTKPYFTVPSDGWTGTWASGDTLVFTTHPATIPIWQKRVVPAGSSSLSGNRTVLVCSGESS